MWRAFSWYGIRKLIRFSELWWCVWWLLFWWGFTQIFILSRGAVLLVLWLLALIGVGCFYASSFSRLAQAIGVGINILLMIGGLFWVGIACSSLPEQGFPLLGVMSMSLISGCALIWVMFVSRLSQLFRDNLH